MRTIPAAASIAIEPEGFGDLLPDRGAGEVGVHRHPPAEHAARAERAEEQVRVGHRGLRPAAPVADGPRLGAGAARADLHQTVPADIGDRAAAGAEGGDREHGGSDVLPRDAAGIGLLDPAVGDDRDVGRGAAHVERDHVGAADQRAERPARHRARRRPRQKGLVGEPRAELDPHQPAMRLHQEQLRRPDPGVLQRRAEAEQIGLDPGTDIGVDRGGGEPRVFADRRQDLRRQRDPEARRLLGGDFRRAALVRRVAEAEQVAHRERFDPLRGEPADRLAQPVLVERRQHRAGEVEAFDRLRGARLGNEEPGFPVERIEQIVDVGLRPAAGLVDRAEPFGDQEARAGAVLLDQRVGRDRGAVDEKPDVRRRDAGPEQLLQRIDHRARGILRYRRDLHRAPFAGSGFERD